MNQVLNKNSWNSIPSAPLYQLLALQLALTEPMQDGIELSARAALASCNRELLAHNFPPPAKSRKMTALVGIVWERSFKGCLDWDSFATFLRLFSDADAQVRKRRDSFASTQVIELCWVRRVGSATQTRLSKA